MSIDLDFRAVALARKTGRDCVCGNLRRATRVVTKLYDDALRPSGLKTTQFGLLSSLMALGSSTLSELAEETVVDRTTLTRNLEILEARGLIAIKEGDDRRERHLMLTDQGVAAVAAAHPLWQAAQCRALEMIGRTNWEASASVLRRIASSSTLE